MTLEELIDFLSKQDKTLIARQGFGNPHSYRGYYDQLAFEPMKDVTIGEMLKCAKSSLGKTFIGWKGGEFQMNSSTDVWLAEQGCLGEGIGPILLDLMIRDSERNKVPFVG